MTLGLATSSAALRDTSRVPVNGETVAELSDDDVGLELSSDSRCREPVGTAPFVA